MLSVYLDKLYDVLLILFLILHSFYIRSEFCIIRSKLNDICDEILNLRHCLIVRNIINRKE